MASQRNQNNQNNLGKEEQHQGLILPDFKIYYKVTIIPTVCHWCKDIYKKQWNRLDLSIQSSDFLQGIKTIKRGKISPINKWAEKVDIHMLTNEAGPLPYNISKNQFKMDQRPTLKTNSIKIL
jgi:hypothetical protein